MSDGVQLLFINKVYCSAVNALCPSITLFLLPVTYSFCVREKESLYFDHLFL